MSAVAAGSQLVAPQPPARCDAGQRRAILVEARRLGVPAAYGRLRKLRLVTEPRRLDCIGLDVYGRPQWMTPPAAAALGRMRRAAAGEGLELQLVSAFRSAEYQLGILRRKLERGLSVAEILAVSAAPGYSEHHSGRAVDLACPGYAVLEEEFARSPAFTWLQANAGRFGFRISYPRGNPHGITWEPWHWCWSRRR